MSVATPLPHPHACPFFTPYPTPTNRHCEVHPVKCDDDKAGSSWWSELSWLQGKIVGDMAVTIFNVFRLSLTSDRKYSYQHRGSEWFSALGEGGKRRF